MRIKHWICLLLCTLCSARMQAATFTVGSDAACTHSNILSAISAASANGPGIDDIRIATNQTYANQILPIVGHSVNLRGGYASCAATTQAGYSGTATGVNGTISTSGEEDGSFCMGAALSAGLISTVSGRQILIEDNCRTSPSHAVNVAENARVDSSVRESGKPTAPFIA